MKWMGVDESGKGDYFGYLVVAAVIADDVTAAKLRELGVKDSKVLSDSAAARLATKIKKICKFDIVRISPEKYNSLYKKFKSLNKMLAWGHARVIENMLQKNRVDFVVTDKFGEESFLKKTLFENGRKAKIIQKIRAESDPAVAAASVLARAEFLRTLKMLSMAIGYSLPKGATHVEESAKHLVAKHGGDVLDFVAKRHFRTTRRVLGK